ncbi:DUF3102 domain-containing protein [Desulfosporosinus sp. PR]|uniref:DUF3102 domain-containing protein n=1 Tax=Candidatus Desulfosporosinus nitrosoreducens TaxID=3401928 RepID=UPI0027EAAB7B|nr:DUF3102 domain-containing protein [Desulfosporosinus sp. PR]MDQ7091992.1 DUF3102 domain-containing protein [Desulfosporosinus sp. PR]
MEDLSLSRTPAVIAVEINTLRHQTSKIVLAGAVEIGRRLKEVKEMLPYGEWGKWLEDSFSYSQKTAEKLIRLFEAYAPKQSVSLTAGAPALEETLPDLNYTQAFLLLGVPEADRAQFIAELDIKNMSTRELQKAVNERNQALKERDEALRKHTELEKALDDQTGKIARLSTERDELKAKAEDLKKSQAENEVIAGKLQQELSSIKQSVNYKELERTEKDLKAAYSKISANRVAYLYENLDKTFKELTWEMKHFAAKDPDTHKVYKEKVINLLSRGLTTEM